MKPALKIISGGQTGVDRNALEWAVSNHVPHGGWCPKGRKAEDGIIPPQFHLRETASENYSVRTRRNVRDSGGTVIFTRSTDITGGTSDTIEFAKEIRKPWIHLLASSDPKEAAVQLDTFLKENSITVLNVAGPRESEESGIGDFVKRVLSAVLIPEKR